MYIRLRTSYKNSELDIELSNARHLKVNLVKH